MSPRDRVRPLCRRGRVSPPAVVIVLVLLLGGWVAESVHAQPTRRSVAVLEIDEDDGPPDPVKTHGARYLARVAGLPFKTTTRMDSAARHAVILATSGVDSGTFSTEEREQIRRYLDRGGVFIAGNFKAPNLFDAFGIRGEDFDRGRHRLTFRTDRLGPAFDWIDRPRERTISLGDTTREQVLLSRSYEPAPSTEVLARFDDGSAALTRSSHGDGHAYLLGLSLRDVTVRNHINRDFTAERSYSNGFEPTTDVFPLLLRSIFRTHVPHAVWKHTSPLDTRSSVMITHDVDSESGMQMMNRFAAYEQQHGIRATYYVTTHYVDDHLQGDFYTMYRDSVARLHDQGQRIGSHSVGHFPDFDDLPLGTLGNSRDTYQPAYNGERTVDGTILGELEVSKQLLEEDVPQDVLSFRAGHLLYPSKLVNALDTLGYRVNTTFSANAVLASFPYRNVKGRTFDGSVTDVWEIPMTISDVFDEAPISPDNYPDKVDVWLRAFERYAENGAPVVLLIHPNREYKLDAERRFVERLPSDVAMLSLEAYGRFWRTRSSLEVTTRTTDDQLTIQLGNRRSLPDSVSLVVEDGQGIEQIRLRNRNGAYLSFDTTVRADSSVLVHSTAPTGNDLLAEKAVDVRSEGMVDFGQTGVDVGFYGATGSGLVRVLKIDGAPPAAERVEAAHVSDYHYVVDAPETLSVDSMVVSFDASSMSGVDDPHSVTVYRQPVDGSAEFAALPTHVDGGGTRSDATDDEVYVQSEQSGRFVLASDSSPLPVELSTFEGTWGDGAVRLTWTTASETNNAGFRVQRQAGPSAWRSIGSVQKAAGSVGPDGLRTYRFSDSDIPFARDSLTYRLEQVDTDGSTTLSETVTVERARPGDVALYQTAPNPARSSAVIRYALPDRRDVRLTVHDMLGRRVRTLSFGVRAAGRHRVTMGVSDLASGVYFLRLNAGPARRTEKMTVVR